MATTRRKRRPDPAALLAAKLQARRKKLERLSGDQAREELKIVVKMLDEVL